jgi:hypothetical protein
LAEIHSDDSDASRRVAIRTLGEQWRFAFEIGRANMELGKSDVPQTPASADNSLESQIDFPTEYPGSG